MILDKEKQEGVEIPVEFGSNDERQEDDPQPTNSEELSQGGAQTESSADEPEKREADEKYLRLLADFENYRKRMRERESEVTRQAEARLVEKLLPVLDDLERLLSHAEQRDDPFVEGARLIYQKFLDTLRKEGLEAVDGQDQPFDPELHHAVQVAPVADPEMDGKVVAVAKKGYRYKDRLLRPADVVVGKYDSQT